MLQALTPYVQVHLIVKDSNQQNDIIKKLLRIGVDTIKIKYFYSPYWHFWLRDYGAVFMKGNKGHLMGIDFGFNCYGNCLATYQYAKTVDSGDSSIAASMGLEVVKANIVSEGGDREFNGDGVMITNEAVEFQRNPAKSKEQLETEIKRVLHVNKIIWLKYPTVSDIKSHIAGRLPTGLFCPGGTGGHVDKLCRFINKNTLLVARKQKADLQIHYRSWITNIWKQTKHFKKCY
jgi:agmatine deiminase